MKEAVVRFCGWLAGAILAMGYPGILLLMAVESSFIPFPSELIMPPAGYLISKGEMSWALVLSAGINYFLALYLGRPFFLKYGKYFLISREKIERCERFFDQHGEITTFVGRLIPMIRQLISLPAGMARMNLLKFSVYTALGAGIWITVLTVVGFLVGENEELLHRYMSSATIWTVLAATGIVVVYVAVQKHRSRKAALTDPGSGELPGEDTCA